MPVPCLELLHKLLNIVVLIKLSKYCNVMQHVVVFQATWEMPKI